MNRRATTRLWIDAFADATGVLSLLRRRASKGATMLMYHRILPRERLKDYFEGLALPPDVFEAQVAWLSAHCTVVPAREAAARMRSGDRSAEKPLVSVSFDDGYLDNFEQAAVILERYGVRGTFFVATDYVLHRRLFWFDAAGGAWKRDPRACGEAFEEAVGRPVAESSLASLDAWLGLMKGLARGQRASVVDALRRRAGGERIGEFEEPMTPGMLRELHERGHEVASHTVTHPMLPELDDAALARECRESKRVLEACLGATVDGICYPNGRADARVAEASRQAGYAYGCTTRPGLNTAETDPMLLHRNHASFTSVTDTRGRHHAASFAAVTWGLHAAVRNMGY